MYHFCTIITPNYLAWAQVLRDSIVKQHANSILYVLVSCKKEAMTEDLTDFTNIHYLFVDDLCADALGKKLYDKYYILDVNSFRWSMKSVMLEYLLTQKTDKAIFIDCDISFYGDFSFLYKDLDTSDILLTQHWRTIDPEKSMMLYKSWFDYGLYNAGFIGVNKNAIKMLQWWGSACLSLCSGLETRYYFSDQFHLNLVPLFFEKTKVLTHLGCNTGLWTLFEHKITEKNNIVYLDDKDPLIFFHYTHIKSLKKQNLPTNKLIEDFLSSLKDYKFDISIYDEVVIDVNKTKLNEQIKKTTIIRKVFNKFKKLHTLVHSKRNT
jgi:hypothetical protein